METFLGAEGLRKVDRRFRADGRRDPGLLQSSGGAALWRWGRGGALLVM